MAEKTEKKYIEAVGRRKTSVARARITPSTKTTYKVNDKGLSDYFPHENLVTTVEEAFKVSGIDQKFTVTVKTNGGGIHSQADAIRLAISRALIKFNIELRKDLKKAGFLKRDPRAKERKKPGLKKARKRPQWSKR
jgi:small subunit ribosomal protein S9